MPKTLSLEKTLSVIIPCYNYAQYLPEAIESVLNQTEKAHEIIVVSDGAIDNSVEVAKRYPVKIIEKANGGLASARNAGCREATGSYLMSFDSDDIMRQDCIKEHMKLAEPDRIVTCGLMAFGSESYTARPKVATVPILLKTNVIYSNTVFPKQAWIDTGGFDESETMRLGWEDREFWLRVLGHGYKSVVSDYVALLWRRHPQTMSSTSADPNSKILQDYIFNKNYLLDK
jgi:glycosyltransferase involved in cell wall biosynthesis